jgi:hypothetical protein
MLDVLCNSYLQQVAGGRVLLQSCTPETAVAALDKGIHVSAAARHQTTVDSLRGGTSITLLGAHSQVVLLQLAGGDGDGLGEHCNH